MTKEEAENGRDDMLINGFEQANAIPDGFNSTYLRIYYDGKHPACDKSYFGRREFSFTLENDIYIRFQPFNSVSELENSTKEKCPFKIDIGPVYGVDPAKRHAYVQSGDNVFTPVERELVFDIVKVSIKNFGTENLIVLKDGSGECNLDFKDLIVHNSAKSYVNFLSQTPTTAFIFVAAILILASGCMCISFRWRQLTRNGLKYQRLDMKLPVSGGLKTKPDVSDGWHDSWGDNWDDEEAPMTPSIPVTPSLSSKGLASRRLSKEGWRTSAISI